MDVSEKGGIVNRVLFQKKGGSKSESLCYSKKRETSEQEQQYYDPDVL